MSLTIESKKAVVAQIAAQIGRSQALVLAQYRGLHVGEITPLRIKARSAGVHFSVLKNTLVRRAVAGTPFAKLADQMTGPLAYAMGKDPVAVAKVLTDFAKTHDKFVIRAGSIADHLMSAKDVAALASLPSREELLAMLLRTMKGPVSKLVQTLHALPTQLVWGLSAVREAKERAAAG